MRLRRKKTASSSLKHNLNGRLIQPKILLSSAMGIWNFKLFLGWYNTLELFRVA